MGHGTGVGLHAALGMFNADGGGVGSWAHCSSVLWVPKCRIPGPTLDLWHQDLHLRGLSPALQSKSWCLCTLSWKPAGLDGQVYQNWVWVTCVWRLQSYSFPLLVIVRSQASWEELNRTDYDSLFPGSDSADSDPSSAAWCLVGLHVSEDISRQIPYPC